MFQRNRLIVLAVAVLGMAAPQRATADFVMTVSGSYTGPNEDPRVGLTYSSDRYDGTNEYFNDLPNLFNLSRLAGGTFTATLRVPTGGTPGSGPDSTQALYSFAPGTVGFTFTLFDASGAMVNSGASGPGTTGLGLVKDNYGSLVDAVQLGTNPFDTNTTVSGLLAPPLLGGETDLYGGAAVLFESNDLSALSGLAIPSDEATYLRLKGAVFVASAGIDTFSPDGDQYAEVLSGASYRITGVTVSSVPEPVVGHPDPYRRADRVRLRPTEDCHQITLTLCVLDQNPI